MVTRNINSDVTATQTVKTLVDSMHGMGTKCVGLAQKIMQDIMPTINRIKDRREDVRTTCYFKSNGELKKKYENMSLAEAFGITNQMYFTVGLVGERKVKIAINIFSDMYLYDLATVEEFDKLIFDKFEDCILTNLTYDVYRRYISDIVGERIFSAIFY